MTGLDSPAGDLSPTGNTGIVLIDRHVHLEGGLDPAWIRKQADAAGQRVPDSLEALWRGEAQPFTGFIEAFLFGSGFLSSREAVKVAVGAIVARLPPQGTGPRGVDLWVSPHFLVSYKQLLSLDELETVDLFADHVRVVRARFPDLAQRRLVHEVLRRMINERIEDLLAQTLTRLAEIAPTGIDEVRLAAPLAAFSDAMLARVRPLKQLLHSRLYRHARVVAVMDEARAVVRGLFERLLADPALLPDEHRIRNDTIGPRAVSDYIAGMTDRFAIREFLRIAGDGPAAAALLASPLAAGALAARPVSAS